LHFPRAFGPADYACAEKEPRVAILWRPGIFRRADLPHGGWLWQ